MKVTLKKDHKHAGVLHKAGSTVDVPVIDAIWLKGQDLIHETVDAIEAEARKLATKDQPKPHADELAQLKATTGATTAAVEETTK